jgi:hypothetical protein
LLLLAGALVTLDSLVMQGKQVVGAFIIVVQGG